MFYSHEILTSREGGLATVWLLATLGSKSVSKKVNKKAIQDVNVPKTCDIIIHPEAPMALRLQSNLLYGVSRVFSQQSGFVLSDAQLMQTNMRALLKAVRTSNLDPEAGKARRDQITIEDDSAFIPDLTFDIDLHALEMSTTESSRRSSLLSPHTARSSLSSQPEGSMTGLVIPSSSGGGGDIGGFQLPSEQGSSIQRQQRINRLLEDDGEAFGIDPGFSIDADGNMVTGPAAADETLPGARVRTPDDRGILPPSSEVRAGTQGAQYDPGLMDFAFDDQVQFQDDGAGLPQAEAFPTGAQQQRSSSQAAEDEESESAEAAMHRRHRPARKARALPFDNVQELRTAELTGWQENYTANMAEVQQSRDQHRAPFLAKKRAFDWVLGSGIGGVGDAFPSLRESKPLDMFTGDSMLEMITGVRPSAGRKRDRDEDSAEGTDSETRRKRLQEEEGGEIGRGEVPPFQDDDMGFQASDDIEIGRHGATPLADDPTFPWNTTASALASRQGSSIAHRGGDQQPLGFASSVAAAGRSAPPSSLRLGSLDRRASRVASSSPLRGRGGDDVHPGSVSPEQLPSDEPYQGFGNDDDDDDVYDAFEVHGPAAGVGTQVQASSQWLRATMNQEAVNFFDFVRETIEALPPPLPVAGGEEGGSKLRRRVEFEQLLPPGVHSTVIAAQGLHHVLALATKNLLDVEQREAFGGIRIGVRE